MITLINSITRNEHILHISISLYRLEREASKYTLVSFQTFLRCTEAHHLLNALEGGSLIKKLISREFDDGIGELVLIMSKNCKLEDLVINYQYLSLA